MATLVCTPIKLRGSSDKSYTNYTRVVSLLNYISTQEANTSKNDTQSYELIDYISGAEQTHKCTAVMFLNSFSIPDAILTDKNDIEKAAETAKQEFASVIDGSKYRDNPAILRHFVLSWSAGGQQPTREEMMLAVRNFAQDMGYRADNLILAGIHSNTGNLHVHVFVLRLSAYDDDKPPVRENGGWTANARMAFLARESVRQPDVCALEPSVKNIFRPVIVDGQPVTETIRETHPIDGEPVVFERPVVERMTKRHRKLNSWGSSVGAMEKHQGIKSYSRTLAEIVEQVDAKIKSGWKWGHLFRALVQNGVYVDVSGPENNRGLVLSLDGEHWRRATKIAGDGWKISELKQRLGAAEFRPPRKNINEIAAAARAKHPLGELKIDDEIALVDECSGIETEIAATQTPLLHRPLRPVYDVISRPVFVRRNVESTPERQAFSQDLAQRIAAYNDTTPVAPAPVMETMSTRKPTKKLVRKKFSPPIRHKSFLPPATFRLRSRGLFRFSWKDPRWSTERLRTILLRENAESRYRIAMARAWADRQTGAITTDKTEAPAPEMMELGQ